MLYSVILPALLSAWQGFTTAAEFHTVLAQLQVGRRYHFERPGSDADLVYLGTVTDARGRVAYHVVREAGAVQAALVRHGYSRLLFFGPDKKLAVEYELSEPDDLPYRLRQNVLYFRAPAGGDHTQPLGLPLPKCICVAPRDCYFR